MVSQGEESILPVKQQAEFESGSFGPWSNHLANTNHSGNASHKWQLAALLQYVLSVHSLGATVQVSKGVDITRNLLLQYLAMLSKEIAYHNTGSFSLITRPCVWNEATYLNGAIP